MDRTKLRQTIARLLGDLPVIGTGTAGTATTITDTANLIHAVDDQLNGYEVYVYAGTNIGKSRIISDFVAADDKITFATMTAVCDTTTKYEIHRKHRVADYERAIDMAIDTAKIAVGRDKLNYYVDKIDETLIMNDILMGAGQFERWSSGTSSAPDGFTLKAGSSVARDSTYVDKGSYSAKLTNAGAADGYLQWAMTQYLKYAEKSFSLYGRFWTGTADRLRAHLNDGVTTTEYSSYHTGSSGFEDFEIENFEIDADPTEFTLQLRNETGGALIGYWDNVRLLSSEPIYEYTLPAYPSPFATISEVWIEGGTEGVFNYLVPKGVLHVVREPSLKLVFDPRYFSIRDGKRIKIIGQARASISREVKDEYIIAFACWYLAMGETGSEEMLTKAQLWGDEKEYLLRLMLLEKQELQDNVAKNSRALADSIIIERI